MAATASVDDDLTESATARRSPVRLGVRLKPLRDSAYYRSMTTWLQTLRQNWDALLAVVLVYAVIAIYLGPVYYFVFWYVSLCGYIIRTALKR